MAFLKQTLGFLGAGNMALALARGVVAAGLVEEAAIHAADPLAAARERFTVALPAAQVSAENSGAADADVVFVAVKPAQVADVLRPLAKSLSDKLVNSIAAGVSLDELAAAAPKARLVRVMPNTPALVGQGAAAFALGPNATEEDAELVERLLSAVGRCRRVEEKLLDAVTGLSGSGPAYAFVMIEALADGGVKAGLPRDVAEELAAQTLKGAAEMVLAGAGRPAELKDRVASPGGTTIAGLAALEGAGFPRGLHRRGRGGDRPFGRVGTQDVE